MPFITIKKLKKIKINSFASAQLIVMVWRENGSKFDWPAENSFAGGQIGDKGIYNLQSDSNKL